MVIMTREEKRERGREREEEEGDGEAAGGPQRPLDDRRSGGEGESGRRR